MNFLIFAIYKMDFKLITVFAFFQVDHLNGQIFIDIMEKKSFSCATWQAVNHHGGQLSIPFYPKKPSIPLISRKRAIVS